MEPARQPNAKPKQDIIGNYHFDDFRFIPETFELFRGRHKVPLKVQSARVLNILLKAHGELVGREAIIHEIWSDRVVEFDLSLNACIRDIRTALGDNAHDQRYIETLSKRGYRFNPNIPIHKKANGSVRKSAWKGKFALAALAGLVMFGFYTFQDDTPLPQLKSAATPEQTEAARALVLSGVTAIYDQTIPDYSKAISDFQKAIVIDPSYTEAHMMLARTVFTRGELDQIHLAEQSLDTILVSAPDDIEALALRGSINWTIHHDWQAAKVDFETILGINPDFSQAYIFLASYYSVMGDFSKSLEQINQALTLNTVQISGNGNVGWYYYLAGRHQEAIRYCDETQAINPDGAGTRRCYLNNLMTIGDFEQAAEHALALMKLKGLNESELLQLETAGAVAILEYFNKFEATLQIAEESRSDPAFLFKAIALTRLGNNDDALETLNNAYSARNYFLPFIRVVPDLKPLYAEKSFQDLLREMNFTPNLPAKS